MPTVLNLRDSLDYAVCPCCKCSTPIRQSKFSLVGEYQKWTRMDGASEFFVCRQCNLIGEIPARGLEPRSAIYESRLSPDPEEVPLLLCEIPTQCAGEVCKAPATLYVAWNSDRNDEPDAKSARQWILTDFVCPNGHPFQLPWQLQRK